MITINADGENIRVERRGRPTDCFDEMIGIAYILTKYLSDDIEIPMERAAIEIYQIVAKIISDPENEIKEVK